MMLEDRAVLRNPESGQVTLMHLLLGIAFFIPVGAATTLLWHSGGGALRYLVIVPSALALGALIVTLDWKLGKAAWLRCQRCSKHMQNAVAIGLFAAELLWIAVGAVSGFKLATFVAEHFAQ
ncbi:MAG: hypothetical protein WBV69_20130 [Candidatus Sulfotelmatobacter sp.]